MRRQRIVGPATERRAEHPKREEERSDLRRVQWSTYYHRFFGRVRPGDRIPGGFEPLSLDAATETLERALRKEETPKPRKQYLARRCVSQMLLYGYRPATDRRTDFDRLTKKAAKPDADEDDDDAGRAKDDDDAGRAKEFLIRWGEREFGRTPISDDQVKQEMKVARKRMISFPTTLTHVQGAFEVEKKVYLRTDLERVSRLVNPENWERMGEFFAKTYREGSRENRASAAAAKPWDGILREDFIVSWNGLTSNVFKQRLKVDYTVTPEVVRTDYALMYEEDDQITTNEGFLEVKAESGLPHGWVVGRMKKKLKFTSSMLNLLSPALLSMMLDSKVGGFNNFLARGGAQRFKRRR